MRMQECRTCWRGRPEDEFALDVGDGCLQHVPLCRSCREKLWDNPEDAGELHDPGILAKAEFRVQRLAAIEPDQAG